MLLRQMWLFPRRREQRSGLSTPDEWLFDSLGAPRTSSGERVSVDSSLQISDVFTAVSIIAETIGSLPLKTYREGPDGEALPAPTHRAYRMLHSAPNPEQPAHRFWSTVTAHLLLWGNFFIEKLRDEEGLVAELWLLHPSAVTVEWNEALRRKRFVVNADPMGVSKRVLDGSQVLHGYGCSADGIIGMSPIRQAREALGTAKARERFESEVYGQKPFLTGVIKHPGSISDAGVKLRESWSAIYGGGGSSSRHSVAVLEEGAEYMQLTAPLEDMQFVESANLSTKKIASLFKLPPSYLGGSTGDSLTYQTVESNAIQFATQAIAPVATNIQKYLTFDMGIFPFSSWYAEFSLQALMRGDANSRAAFYKTMHDIGALHVDEIRTFENLPPREPPAGLAASPAALDTEVEAENVV